jgi:hypothetical protein
MKTAAVLVLRVLVIDTIREVLAGSKEVAAPAGSGPNTLRVLVQLGVVDSAGTRVVPELSNSPTTTV